GSRGVCGRRRLRRDPPGGRRDQQLDPRRGARFGGRLRDAPPLRGSRRAARRALRRAQPRRRRDDAGRRGDGLLGPAADRLARCRRRGRRPRRRADGAHPRLPRRDAAREPDRLRARADDLRRRRRALVVPGERPEPRRPACEARLRALPAALVDARGRHRADPPQPLRPRLRVVGLRGRRRRVPEPDAARPEPACGRGVARRRGRDGHRRRRVPLRPHGRRRRVRRRGRRMLLARDHAAVGRRADVRRRLDRDRARHLRLLAADALPGRRLLLRRVLRDPVHLPGARHPERRPAGALPVAAVRDDDRRARARLERGRSAPARRARGPRDPVRARGALAPYAYRVPVCLACSQENPDNARFCLACGAALEAVAPRDERRVVTVIFVDLVGFTARAERLDPEDVRALLTPYHDRVRREIESFGGVVEKFIGDAVMGIFGAPLAHGDDAERAVRAALVVRDGIHGFVGGELQIRIAVNTGEAVVSLDARPALGESMVAGDVVNTAARLQAGAPVNGIVVGEKTYLETRDVIAYEEATPVVAKGKSLPVKAWVAMHALTEAGERPVRQWSIVGREPELAVLNAIWQRTLSERLPHLVSIVGPAGVGKSTVAAEFATTAGAAGARIVRGRSLPYRESGVYGALATQLMRLCGTFESDPPEVIAERLQARTAALLDGTSADPRVVAAHLGLVVGIDAGADAPGR